jgi:hypothetical protein
VVGMCHNKPFKQDAKRKDVVIAQPRCIQWQ